MSKAKDQVRWIALLAAVAAALYLCWLMLQPFTDVVAWAAVLVIIFYPVHRRIVARIGNPSIGALLSCLLVITTILVPLTLVTIAVVDELTNVARNLQENIQAFLDPNSPSMQRALGWLGQYFNVEGLAERLRSQQFLIERLRGMSGQIANRTVGLVGGLVGTVVQIAFIIFTMFYFFRDGNRIIEALRDMLPLEPVQANEILSRTRNVISASVYGVLIIALIQGVLGGLAFWVLGLPSALVWGVLMTLLSLIPMAGSFIVWAPAAVFLIATAAWLKGLILIAWGALVIGSIDNFLRPKLVGEKTHLHELLIFFSVLGGLQVFGVLGIVLGPVVVAVALALVEVARQACRPPEATIPEPSLIEEQAAVRNDAPLTEAVSRS